MILLLSPAKSLDYETALPEMVATTPLFAARSAELITTLQKKICTANCRAHGPE